jgi:hypothetical protein
MTKEQLHQTHIDELTLASFIDNRLLENERNRAMEHLAQCPRCRKVLYQSTVDLQTLSPKNGFSYRSKVLSIAASMLVVAFGVHHFWQQEEFIYKGGTYEITQLEIPTINQPKSLCTNLKQQEAKRYLEESYSIIDEYSSAYFEALSNSLRACYSPEVATKLYSIKADKTTHQETKIELLKEALYHISYSVKTTYRLSKEIEIFQKLKPCYKGVDKQDIINKIHIRQKELDAIANNDD